MLGIPRHAENVHTVQSINSTEKVACSMLCVFYLCSMQQTYFAQYANFLYADEYFGKTQCNTVAKNLPENGANMRTHEPGFLK